MRKRGKSVLFDRLPDLQGPISLKYRQRQTPMSAIQPQQPNLDLSLTHTHTLLNLQSVDLV